MTPFMSRDASRIVVLVDAENVRRSKWPNVSGDELERLAALWAEANGVHADVVWEGETTADDAIAGRAAELAATGTPYWLATSDRELRERAGPNAERVIGGGSFLRELLGVA
jgi:hypothetical protein